MRLTLVIPVYNEQKLLKKCLEAVAKQTVMPDEVIVVDNNSTDKTVEIAQSFEFVKVIAEPKQGIRYSRTTGFNAATGDIIARTDGDTMLSHNWVELVKEVFEDPTIDAVTGTTVYHDAPFKGLGKQLTSALTHKVNKRLLGHPIMLGANMAMRKTAWEAVRDDLCDDPDIHEDLDIAIHLARLGKVILVEPELVVATSFRKGETSFTEYKKYFGLWPQTYKKHGLNSEVTTLLYYAILLHYPSVDLLMKIYKPIAKRTTKRSSRSARPAQ